MVRGIDSFRKHFVGYEDCYTIIGGTACEILMSDAALEFRATKDIDIILLVEDRFVEFGKRFWAYIKEGGYRCGWKGNEAPEFFRFTEPANHDYPLMIELFSRRPDFQANHPEIYLTPLPIADDISSLSAIMLDDDYYQLMLTGRRSVNGVSVLDAEYLIVFKAKAWLDLSEKKAAGIHVNDRDLRKHRADVFRLYNIIEPSKRIPLSGKVASEMNQFLSIVGNSDLNIRQYGITDLTMEEVIEDLRAIFELNQ